MVLFCWYVGQDLLFCGLVTRVKEVKSCNEYLAELIDTVGSFVFDILRYFPFEVAV